MSSWEIWKRRLPTVMLPGGRRRIAPRSFSGETPGQAVEQSWPSTRRIAVMRLTFTAGSASEGTTESSTMRSTASGWARAYASAV